MSFYERGGDAYAALAAHLREQIISGQLPPGSRLPSKATMERTLDVSSEVAEMALAQLKREGWTEGRRGGGTVVRHRPEPRVVDMSAPADDVAAEVARLRAAGHSDVEVFEELWPRIPTPEEVERLGVPAGLPVVVRVREYMAGGELVARTETVERGEASAFRYRLPLE